MAEKTYTDPAGQQVPAKYVPAYDKLRDQIARRIARRWQDEQARLAQIKAETVTDIEKLIEAAAKAADVSSLGGEKGNVQFRSFDGSITIGRDRQFRTEFDERLQFAQQLINQAIAELTDGSNADLAEIARKAFQPRKTGNLDMQRIRDLRTYNVRHPKWRQACEIISECERTVAYRDYIRVAVRQSSDAKPTAIILDIASL
jgi:hypothetical protein